MSESRTPTRLAERSAKLLNANGAPLSDYRVWEDGGRLAIRRVHYGLDGAVLRVETVSPAIEGKTGDDLVALLNELAMALTKPSVISDDVVGGVQ